MASSLNASTSGGGGIITTADATGNLNIQSGGSTVVAVTSAGVAVTGTLSATGAITGSSTVAGSTGILYPLTSGTSVASTSGTSIDFTGIPSWVKRITLMFDEVSLSGTSGFLVQLGDAGGIETTGYTSTVLSDSGGTSTNSTAGFVLVNAGASAGAVWRGALTLSLRTTNTFIGTASITRDNGAQYSSGRKALSDTITQLRLTTINGTDTFDAGSVNILYE